MKYYIRYEDIYGKYLYIQRLDNFINLKSNFGTSCIEDKHIIDNIFICKWSLLSKLDDKFYERFGGIKENSFRICIVED